MKKNYLCFIICICFLSIFFFIDVIAKINDSIISVYGFNSETKKFDRKEISGMSSIGKIVTANNFAWAFNFPNQIAFYNGSQWTPAVQIKGIMLIEEILPSFPISGRQPNVWVLGLDKDHRPVIATFDGSNWSEAKQITNGPIDSNDVLLQASSGYAWVRYKDLNGPHIKVAYYQNPLNWTEITNLPRFQFISQIVSFDDRTPYCYIYGSDLSKWQLIRLYPQAVWKVINNFPAAWEENSILVENNNIILSMIENSSINHIAFSSNYGDNWNYLPLNNYDAYTVFNFMFQIYNNKMCIWDYTDPRSFTKYKCFNGEIPNSSWQNFQLPSYIDQETQSKFYTTDIGAFIVSNSNDQTHFPFVFRYNIYTNKLDDLQITKFANDLTSAEVKARAIGGNSELISCGTDLNKNPAAFYFNGSTWSSSVLNLDKDHVCCLSTGGNTVTPIYTTKDKNVWIFPSFGMCLDRNKKIKLNTLIHLYN